MWAPDVKPYRLTAYLLDSYRNGRTQQVTVTGADGALHDARKAEATATTNGVHLSWTVTGSWNWKWSATELNPVVSAVFVDTK